MSNRSVFEEVNTTAREAASQGPLREPARRAIAVWLMSLAALVAVMVLVGGATRLTDSGLSITEWAPVMGALPPMTEADWNLAFEAYKTTTEYQTQNAWMSLADFKPIYWWEWGHRFLGRLVGLVWAVGFVWFLVSRAIPSGWTAKLAIPGVLGGVQGAIGWWMVSSGLSDRTDVAPYRLAVHLGLAFVIFGLLVWLILRVQRDEVATLQARRQRISRLMPVSGLMIGAVLLQILLGALVAGLDAGRGYIDWPLMEGSFLPPESFDLSPVWLNAFENPALAQFDHRMAAYALVVLAVWFFWKSRAVGHVAVRKWVGWGIAALLLQVVLGVVTVLHAAPLELALLHQAAALALFAILIRARFEIAYPSEQRISAGARR